MIHTKLPDICAFELAQILESRFNMPVVSKCQSRLLSCSYQNFLNWSVVISSVICDTYPESAMLRSVSKGAMYCLSMPLCMEDIANLWQHPVIKKKYYMGETRLSSISGNSSQSWNEGFTWTPYINCKFLDIVWNFGIYGKNLVWFLVMDFVVALLLALSLTGCPFYFLSRCCSLRGSSPYWCAWAHYKMCYWEAGGLFLL